MSASAENRENGNRRRGIRTGLLAGAAAVGGFFGGVLLDPDSTSNGGGVLMSACMDGESTHRMLEGDRMVVGAGDLSISGFPGYTQDGLQLEMIDGVLGVTDNDGSAEEYAGGDFRVASPGKTLSFEEDGAVMTIGLEEEGVVRIIRECQQPLKP
jgi:hypothetical protein